MYDWGAYISQYCPSELTLVNIRTNIDKSFTAYLGLYKSFISVWKANSQQTYTHNLINTGHGVKHKNVEGKSPLMAYTQIAASKSETYTALTTTVFTIQIMNHKVSIQF